MDETTPKRSGKSNVNIPAHIRKGSSSTIIIDNEQDEMLDHVVGTAANNDNHDCSSSSSSSTSTSTSSRNPDDKESDYHGNDDGNEEIQQDNDTTLSSSSSLSFSEFQFVTYMDKINANRKRNQERLVALGFVAHTSRGDLNAVTTSNDTGDSGGNPRDGGRTSVTGAQSDRRKMETRSSDHAADAGKAHNNRDNLGFGIGALGRNHDRKRRQRGMLFHTEYNRVSNFTLDESAFENKSFHEQYPHRKREIILLSSLLNNAVRQLQIPIEMDECGNILNSFCPPPILVHGPSGTGKSTIVRQILKRIEKEASMATCRNRTRLESSRHGTGTGSSRVGTAYVNCKTIEPYGSGASSILQSLYRQLEQGFRVDPQDDYNDDAIVGPRGQVENMMQGNGSMSMDLDTDDDSVIRNSSLHPPRNIRNDCTNDVAVNVDGDSLHDVQNDDEEELIEYYAAKERRGIFQKDSEASTSEKTFTKKSSIGDHAGIRRTRRSARLKTDHGLDSSSKSNPAEYTYLSNPSSLDSTNVSSSTTVSFGRSIAKFCGVSKYKSFLRGCAFIVLDHADELLSFSHNRQKGNIHTNFLSELLLLPKTMKLNLTVIAITDKLMLEQSRLSNIDMPSNTLGTIQSAVCPILCHFPAYQNEEMLRDIMNTPHLMELVVGKCAGTYKYTSDPSIIQLYKSLVDIVIHSVESATHDIGEILRLTRMLWPLYLGPLKKRNAQNKKSIPAGTIIVNRELLEKLGENVRPHLRQLVTKCLLRPFRTLPTNHASAASHSDTSTVSLPYFTKFLLLAAYLCQTNRADTDRLLYTNYRAVRKRRRKTEANSNSNNNDTPTHASTHGSFLDRVASFPLERMLSVFSSICNKYASKLVCDSAGPGTITKLRAESVDTAHLGNLSLMRSLLELRHCGLLEEAASSGIDWSDEKLAYSKSMSSARFICRLSKQEAIEIAKSLSFPLEAYLIQK